MTDIQYGLPSQQFNSVKQCLRSSGRVLQRMGIYHYRTSTHIIIPDRPGQFVIRDILSKKALHLDLINNHDQIVIYKLATGLDYPESTK